MASVDGPRSLQGACDEIFDIFCGPCKTDKVEKEAKNYCTECMEYLCNDCKDAHLKFKMSKHHMILSGNKMPVSPTMHQDTSSCVVYCSCNQNQAVSVYCEKHEEVICQSCKTVKHRNCRLFSIQEKSINYDTARFTSFLTRTKTLKDKIEKLKQKRKSDQFELATLKDGCKKDLTTLRKEIEAFFDSLEQDMLQGFDKSAREQGVTIDKHILSLDTTLQLLDIDCQLLDNANQDGNKETMFASEIKVSKGLKEYDGLIAELQKDITRPILSFIKNKKLNDMYADIHTLGSIKCNNVVMGMTVKSSREVNLKLPNDSHTPIITACCFMPNKSTVFSDRANCSIKLMDESFKYQSRVKLRTGPGDVSVVDDNNVIVTLPEIKQLQFVQIFPKLEVGRVIQLDKRCFGVFVSEDEIFISCHNNPGQGEVQVLDLDGVRKRKIGCNLDGQYMLKSPNFLAVSKSSKRIFLSDDVTSTITCMTSEGNIIYECKDSELKGLAGLYLDAHDNFVVCDTDSARVISITQNGRQYGDLVSSADGLSKPYSIAYRDWDNTLLVGCYYKNNVFCFKLE